MKKINQIVTEWWQGVKKDYYTRRQERRDRALMSESLARVQVMEFGGEIYVSYGGVPLVNVKQLNCGTEEALNDVRSVFRAWRWAEDIYGL